MKIKVRSLSTGKKIKPMAGTEFLLTAKGKVLVSDTAGFVFPIKIEGGYVVEFAFFRSPNAKWEYEKCVVNE